MIMKTSNNTNQVGGNHYQFEIEPVHLMVKYNLNWFQGEILKYVSRHTNKNGKQDLEKALHICDMAIDLKPAIVSKVSLLENGEEYFKTYISQMSILDMFRGLDRSIWTYQNGFVKAIKYLLLGDWVKCREAIFILKMSFYE